MATYTSFQCGHMHGFTHTGRVQLPVFDTPHPTPSSLCASLKGRPRNYPVSSRGHTRYGMTQLLTESKRHSSADPSMPMSQEELIIVLWPPAVKWPLLKDSHGQFWFDFSLVCASKKKKSRPAHFWSHALLMSSKQ